MSQEGGDSPDRPAEAEAPDGEASDTQDAPAEASSGSQQVTDNVPATILAFVAEQAAELSRSSHSLEDVKQQRARLAAERKELTRQLRNKNRQKQRLVSRAQKLTTADLVEVMLSRQQRIARAKAKARASP